VAKVDFAFIGGRGIFSNYGGVENATREITLELAKKDLMLAVYGVKGELENEIKLPCNINELCCPTWIYKKLGQHGMILYCVLHALFLSRPRVVYLFASGPCIFTPLLRLGGLKVVTSLRAIDSARDKWGRLSRNILRFGEYCAWRFSNSFTANSKEMVDHYRKNRNDVVFIPNGAKSYDNPLSSIPEYLDKQEFFLFAARFDPVKRLHLLLEAYSQLDYESAPLLVIAGGNAKDRAYEAQLKTYENKKIIFMGHLSEQELAPLMKNCKAFILPSILEGMSNSLLTAMATGKPVLAANIAANSDVLANKDALYTADSVPELVSGLNRLAKDNLFCCRLGELLKVRAKSSFSWKATAEKFHNEGQKFL
jgi:glycosyltransferase involved in cell wall biosynthesis